MGEKTKKKKNDKDVDYNYYEDIKYVKNLQWQTIYYPILFFVGIIVVGNTVKHPPNPIVVPLTRWLIWIITGFAIFYQGHHAISLWDYRNKAKINLCYQKVLLFVYFCGFISIIIIGAIITYNLTFPS